MIVAQLVVAHGGEVWSIYNEHLDLRCLGEMRISRASNVEPTEHAQWTADVSPQGGPMLGPFDSRAEALSAEVDWLNQNWLVRHDE